MPLLRSATAGSGDAPKQFSQPSRKGKRAWRKNVDLTEVESGLVDLNNQIIQGGVIREKASEDLFTIDVKGDSKETQQSSKKAVKKTLRADEIISQRSAVPAVAMRKRPSSDSKTTDGLVAPSKRPRKDWVSHKELARLRRVADGQHDASITVRDATYDVWGGAGVAGDDDDDNNNNNNDKKMDVQTARRDLRASANADAMETDFIDQKVEAKVPKSMRRQPISLLASGKRAPAVARPTGGFSYNPMFADYEGRLAEESAKAIKAEKKRLEREALDAERQAAAARSAAEAQAAEERAAMSEWEEDSEWEGVQSEAEGADGKTKQPKRKTQAQRNRIARRKEDERQAKHRAAMKARRAQEQRIKEIAQEVADKHAAKALALVGADGIEDREEEEEEEEEAGGEIAEEKLRRKQLGKYKLPERDLELVLPDELQDSLRLLRPEGNLLRDRYRSLLLRGKMESRRHIPFKKQAKKKLTEKWTHKDFII